MKSAAFVLLLALIPGAAAAQPADDADALGALIDDGHAGEAYHRLGAILRADPEDGRMRYLLSLAALRIGRYDEAREHADKGLALYPDYAALLGLRSEIRFIVGGEDVAAAEDAKRALALDPDDAGGAGFTIDMLDVFERARTRRAGARPDLAAGGPAAFTDHVLERAFADATPFEIATFVDLEVLTEVPPHLRTRGMLIDFVRNLMKGWYQEQADQEGGYIGWVVDDTTTSGDRVTVHARLPADFILQRHDVQTAAIRPAWMHAMEEAVRPDEQRALRDRLIGTHNRAFATLDLELAGTGTGYRITNVVLNGMDYRAQFARVSTGMLGIQARKDASGGSAGRRLVRRLVGPLILVGVLVAVVLWLTGARERSRRRRHHH